MGNTYSNPNKIDHVETEKFLSFFRSAINSLYPLSQESWEAILPHLKFKKFKKNDIVLMAGTVPTNLYFICSGTVIIYFEDANDKRYVKNILFKGDFPATTSALLQEAPSNLTVESLDHTLLIALDFREFKKLLDQYEELKNVYLRYLEKKWVIEKEETEIALATQDSEQRYISLIEANPEIETRIPLHYIANYLGISATQLSRVRKKISSAHQHM